MMNKMWKRTSQAPRCQTHQINNPVLNACTLGLCLRHTSARSRAFSSRRARGRGHFGLGRSADRLFTAADRLSAAPSGSRRHQEPVCAYIRAYSVRITGFWQAVRRTVLPHHRTPTRSRREKWSASLAGEAEITEQSRRRARSPSPPASYPHSLDGHAAARARRHRRGDAGLASPVKPR